MILELKKLFLDGVNSIKKDYKLDLSGVKFDGCYPFLEPVNVKVKINNVCGVIKLIADVDFNYFHLCDRCMADMVFKLQYKFNHILVLETNENLDDDYIRVDEYKLDLDNLIKSDLLLELPSKILCKDDCKGICPECGKNLNDGSCDCAMHYVDSRLEVLKNLLD